jgi:hypothetical protein
MSINLIIKDNDKFRKLLAIVPYAGGGFAVILPSYQNTSAGVLEKISVEYLNEGTKGLISRDIKAQFGVDDRVKFSYHPDGFVQFSSASNRKITSGRDASGEPKGLGVISWPLSKPVSTGASMSISFWGLDLLQHAKPKQIDNQYVFDTAQAVQHQKAPLLPGQESAYAMAMYIIPKETAGSIITVNGRKQGYLAMMQMQSNGGQFMRLRELVRYIDIPDQPNFIGISWFRIPLGGFNSRAGFLFSGPTDGKYGLRATFPTEAAGAPGPIQNLMYQ